MATSSLSTTTAALSSSTIGTQLASLVNTNFSTTGTATSGSSNVSSLNTVTVNAGATNVSTTYPATTIIPISNKQTYVTQVEGGGQVIADTGTIKTSAAAFKWVERFISPDMFVSPDSVLIAIGPATANLATATAGTNFQLLGMCNSFNLSQQNTIHTFKELRSERNIIIPGKSTPGQLSINRLMGAFPNIAGKALGKGIWVTDNQTRAFKTVFGIILIFLTYSRADMIASLYCERCAIQGSTIAVQAGEMHVYQSATMIFDRVVDSSSGYVTATVTGAAVPSTTSTATTATTSTNASVAQANAALSSGGTANAGNTVSPGSSNSPYTTDTMNSQMALYPQSTFIAMDTAMSQASDASTAAVLSGQNQKLVTDVAAMASAYQNVQPLESILYGGTGTSRAWTSAEITSLQAANSAFYAAAAVVKKDGVALSI